MKIGIFSDTHDYIPMVKKAMQTFKEKKVEHLLFAGDLVSPFVIDTIAASKIPLTAVFGNNEGEKVFIMKKMASVGEIYDAAYSLELAGCSIFICHYDWIATHLAEHSNYDIIIYGHTHKADIRSVHGHLLINPGECCGYLTGHATIVVLDLPSKRYELIELN